MSLSIVAGAPRDISAPHQTSISGNEYATSRGMPTHVGKGKVNGVTAPSDAQIVNAAAFTGQNYPNYRTFQFQPLEPVGKVVYDKYVGPTPESNWVVPGKLLVGAYPASADDAETLDLITSILRNGVTKFVCLQQEVCFRYCTWCLFLACHATFRPLWCSIELDINFPVISCRNFVQLTSVGIYGFFHDHCLLLRSIFNI